MAHKKVVKKKVKKAVSKKIDYKKGGKKLKQEIKEGKKADKIGQVMEEFKLGKLHSGSKKGPKVKSKKQALAIALSEARRMKKRNKK